VYGGVDVVDISSGWKESGCDEGMLVEIVGERESSQSGLVD